MEKYIAIIPFAPLVGSILMGLITLISATTKKSVPRIPIYIIACLGPLVSFVFSVKLFNEVLKEGTVYQYLFTWIKAGSFSADLSFSANSLTVVMLLFITFISTLIHIYSAGYMAHDKSFVRFFTYLNLFLFSMLLLVLGSNLLIMFVGWEGVGLCSYLLIGFWFTDIEKAKAGKKAFITNRIGDFGFISAIFIVYWTFAGTMDNVSLEFSFIAQNAMYLKPMAFMIALLFFIGASGKSAQIPLYVWLPDAMAGPTPVSALIHAATMVTAGVFMIAKLSSVFVLAPLVLEIVAIVGTATAFFAALTALAQNDIKKILAYSTISQLGYMFMAMGVGAFSAGIFHVLTHAFFKAALFLCAGSIIHAMHEEQDIRKMGGLLKRMPITAGVLIVAWLAIIGIPPFAGFFSKDEILFKTFASGHYVLWAFGFLTAGLTAFYMSRMVFLVLFGTSRAGKELDSKIHESPISMTSVLSVLGLGSLLVGFVGIPHALGGSGRIFHFIDKSVAKLDHQAPHPAMSTEYLLMAASVAIVLVAVFFANKRYRLKATLLDDTKGFPFNIVINKFYIDELYEIAIIKPIELLSRYILHPIFDSFIIDGIIVGFAKMTGLLGKVVTIFQTGTVSAYVLYMASGAVLIIWFFAN